MAIASANLRSARLTILYGPSGVGKSSLLQAGVVHGLREQSRTATDESPFAICTVRSWLDDPIRAVQDASQAALEELAGDEALAAPQASLAESLRVWTEQTGTLLIVLDQFEDYFQYHEDEDGGETLTGFAAELAQIVNDPNLAVNVLLSIREDAWAKLDRFEGHIPLLFANYIRVDHLDADAAREAIEAPIAAWNATLEPGAEPFDIEPALIGAVLTAAAAGDEPAARRRVDRRPGRGAVPATRARAALARNGRGRRARAHARAPRGAGRREADRRAPPARRPRPAQPERAGRRLRLLPLPRQQQRRRRSRTPPSTSRSGPAAPRPRSRPCSRSSAAARAGASCAPSRPGATATTSYELFHDVLAEPILAWRREHERELSRRAACRRLLRVGSVALALIALFAGLSVWALVERSHANDLVHQKQAANESLQADIARLKKRDEEGNEQAPPRRPRR